MSLNDIHLSATTIVDLYKNVLIEPSISKGESIGSAKKPINYLGNNKQQIVILVRYHNAVHIPDAQLTFLTNILTACKLNLDDIAIINLKENSVPFKEICKIAPAKSVLLFDITTDMIALPINFPLFQVQSFDGISYLTAPSLDEIEKDKALKTNLWTSLKKLFKL